MTGMELSVLFFERYGRETLQTQFPALFPRMAIGLAGEGSECFGFDDEISRDHDWGAGFCIWLEEVDFYRYGDAVQSCYLELCAQASCLPQREQNSMGAGRVGAQSITQWFSRLTGCPQGPQALEQWKNAPAAGLAAAINGRVFSDPLGHFSAIRAQLGQYYPEQIRLLKIIAQAAMMSQCGQYNYQRCRKRGDFLAAQLSLNCFLQTGLTMVYLLNKQYAPYYKWLHRGVKDLPRLPQSYSQFDRLCRTQNDAERLELIERICINTAAELCRQGLSTQSGSFLFHHCAEMKRRVHNLK